MANAKNDSPKSFQKNKTGQTLGFKSPSRFSGGFQSGSINRSQFKPTPVRITQHKG